MILSPGFLHSSCKLLELLEDLTVSIEDLTENFNKILLVAPQPVIDISLRCGWVSVNNSGLLVVTEPGKQILFEQDYEVRMRRQIRDYIFHEVPPWATLIPKGRKETISFLPSDVKQCFMEAGLTQTPASENIIEWWDELAASARSQRQDFLGKIGRQGEKLSFVYEKNRVGQDPLWQSIESNLSGYDILSKTSKDEEKPLMIEVKASMERLNAAYLHITRNEWETAILTEDDSYIFHLWLIGNENRLAVISRLRMHEHIPINYGDGVWESISIPYRCFQELFVYVGQ